MTVASEAEVPSTSHLIPQLLATQVLSLVVTIVVMLGVALGILLFERRRAERIRRDLSQMSREVDAPPSESHPSRSESGEGGENGPR